MGYTTEFSGSFQIDKKLDEDTFELINGLAQTRRMKRKGLDPKYGDEGEFFFDPTDFHNYGQSYTADTPSGPILMKSSLVIDENS
jgi:hypothetical protein